MNAMWNETLRANGVFKSAAKLYPSLALTEMDLELTRGAIDLAAKRLSSSY